MPEPNMQVYPKTQQITQELTLAECPTNLQLDNPAHKALLIAVGNPSDMEFDKAGVIIIKATHWAVFPDEGEDPETAELHQFARLVLIQADGRFFRTSSAHAWRRLRAILSLYGPEDWEQGVTFRIERRLSKRGRTYHDIRVMVDYGHQGA